MSLKLPVNNFDWIKYTFQFNEDFMKNCNEESDEGYLISEIQYLEKLHELIMILSFLPERIRIEKVKKLVTNLHDKTEYVIHIIVWKKRTFFKRHVSIIP